MYMLKMIVLAWLRKNAGMFLAILTVVSVSATSLLAQGNSSGTPVSNALPKNTVVATIDAGSNPWSVIVSPDSSTLYVVDNGSNQVSVIDAAPNYAVKTTISVGNGPEFAAITPDGKTLYVTNTADLTVSVISTSSNAVTNTIKGDGAYGVAVTPNGQEAFVASFGSGSIMAINTVTNQVSTITVPGQPFLVAFSPNGKQAYVPNYGGGCFISIIDVATKTVSKKVIGGGEISSPVSIAVAPDGATLYLSDFYNYVAAITADGALKKVTLIVPAAEVAGQYLPGQAVLTPNGKYLYVANYNSNNVVMLSASANKVLGTPIPTGDGPYYAAVAPNGKNLYVANYMDSTVTVIDVAP